MKTDRKIDATIKQWQLHTLSPTTEYLRENAPEVKTERAYILTGTVVEDYKGRWPAGHHFRSSLVLDYNEEAGIVETRNSVYELQGESGDCIPDMGDDVASIFY